MLELSGIQQRLARGRYRLSDHAFDRVVERGITDQMIREAGAAAELVEDYPRDKYSPSCLLLGFTADQTPLHLHVSRVEQETVKLITLYIPDPDRWVRYRVRRDRP